MIGISTKTIYALGAIHQLGLLETNERLNIKALASRANAPEKFLGQILLELKKAHILQSTKGANGGYSLNKALHEISLKDIIFTLETNAFEDICQTNNPTLKLFWEEKQQALIKIFDTPLSELHYYHEKANQNFNYII
ncbi:MAG: Rrf2 family transcriptional regulator [uncultured Sulfurovum sp.]|uniref:Rrf2 family transcriptional regulator n=1 Tax=uncultured Sulfurovum sp. TaxID=269237 RepID=A0A6S6U4N0_9BACT|nr:MAG: Rrf2 family transcriptional regulator [uncultured Sulfurovum sp.]